MPFGFSLGSFRGQSSYLIRSRRGLNWDNLPPSLMALVRLPGMSGAVVDFSLGPHGHYWFQYEGENGQVVTETSQGLWPYLRYDPNSGLEITRLSFGRAKTYWGTNCWVENEQSYQNIFFNDLPQGLVSQITELDNTGQLESYSDIGILALGHANSWVLEWKGWVWSEGIDPELLAALQTQDGVTVTNVCLSPIRTDCWWIEYSDDTTHFRVPAAWNAGVSLFAAPQYALKKKKKKGVGRSISVGLRSISPYAGAVVAVAACVVM